ncbi:MAG: ribbon-helix-helix protein, CopG family [Sulfolobales archaeon]|nr:ribbon-helix-helix protein, CopG family [Sulfolobales archaeon]MCX8208713.1 ribbon-helix-helix protein, CopG family [Sulfolobales archaeon]MDW8010160.1 ribbon-helix-helix protein, CopG family [Sulfolobales archaeon]
MSDDRFNFIYIPHSQTRTHGAKIITFRLNPELNELLSTAARMSGKSKSEFIRDSLLEFIRFLESSLGAEVSLLRYSNNSNSKNKKKFDEYVVLV